MSVRQILALKMASVQMRIDAVSAREAALMAKIKTLRNPSDGLGHGLDTDGAFKVAAQSVGNARALAAKLEQQRSQLSQQRQRLAREKLSLDIADQKLADEDRKTARLKASRASD